MTIHLTHEVLGRLARGELSRDERQVLRKHLDGGPCERCNAELNDSSDDELFKMLLSHAGRLYLQALRRRVEAGHPDAARKLHELRFRAAMRGVRRRNQKRGGLFRRVSDLWDRFWMRMFIS